MEEIKNNEIIATPEEFAVPKNDSERHELLAKIMEMLEKLINSITTKSAYTKREIENLKKQTANIERSISSSNAVTNDALAEIAAYVSTAKNADDRGEYHTAMEQCSKAELTSMSKSIENSLEKGDGFVALSREMVDKVEGIEKGTEIIFNKNSDSKSRGMFLIKDGILMESYPDIESFKDLKDLHGKGFEVSSDSFDESRSSDELKSLLKSAYLSKKEQVQDMTDRVLLTQELNGSVSVEKLNEIADSLKQSLPENTNIVIDEKNSTVFIENPEVPDTKLLIVMRTDEDNIERISSIRLVEDEKFTGKDFDKVNVLDLEKGAKALVYVDKISTIKNSENEYAGKETVIDHRNCCYTTQDKFVVNEGLSGFAKDICMQLAESMDMEIVDNELDRREEEKDEVEKD